MGADLQPTDEKPVIALTLGDAAGIGPEVVAAALACGELDPAFDYRVVGEPPESVRPGEPSAASARAAWDGLEAAAAGALRGEYAAVVTAPVCKASLYKIGFEHPGQTEFFAERCRVRDFAMLLTGGSLTVALVSTHLPLREAIERVNPAEIVRVGKLLAAFLTLRLGRNPKIAVAGLNPHAGEGGSLGREEIDHIQPAVAELARSQEFRGAQFAGPVSPDTVFYQAAAGRWDGVLCMYHDQGLIPLKLHAFDTGVNVTLGLPIIRTSPDHGTAFDLAGKQRAQAGSMIAAIQLASELARKRGAVALSLS